jgi:hypothetical protein
MLISAGNYLIDTENLLYAKATPAADGGGIESIEIVLKDDKRTSFILKDKAAAEFSRAVGRVLRLTGLAPSPAADTVRGETHEGASAGSPPA